VQTVSDAILSTFAGWASGALDSRLAMQQLHRAADQVKRDMESSYRRRPPSKKSPEGARELVDALRAVDEARVRKADVLRAAQPSGGK
jgi:hypothetical protein